MTAVTGLLLAAALAASLGVVPTEATVGDPLQATLTVEVPAGASLEEAAVGPDLGDVAVLSGGWLPADAGSPSRRVWRGTIAAYRTGDVTVPSIEVSVVHDGRREILKTAPVTLRIRSVLTADAAQAKGKEREKPDLSDLKPPATIPPDWGPLRLALAAVAGLAALAAVAFWLNRKLAPRLRGVAAPADPFRRKPPHEWAYEELGRLLARRLAEQGQTDVFFEELARVVKTYLGGRFRVDLLERTTPEVVPALSQAGAPDGASRAARALLERADLAKFARAGGAEADCRAAVDSAYALVDATKPAGAP